MNQAHVTKIAGELALDEGQISAVAQLIEDGATVPFISRYRKEATGSLDEIAVTAIRDRLVQLQNWMPDGKPLSNLWSSTGI